MISVGDAILKITGDTAGLDKSLDGIKGKMGGFGTAMKGVGIGLAAVGTAAVGAGIGAVKSFADAGSEIYDMSKKTGASAQFLSEWKYMAEQSGASLGSVDTAIKRMQASVMSGNKEWADYGINLESLKGLPVEEQFQMITDALMEMEDPSQRAAMAMSVFGRSGTELLPVLSEGKAGMEAMQARARELGVTFTDETAAQADELGDSLGDVQKSMQGLMNEIAKALLPAIKPLITAFLDLIKALPLKEIADLISGLLPPLVSLLLQLLKAIPVDMMVKFVSAALKPMLQILTAVLPILEPILFLFGQLLGLLTPVLDILGRVLSFIARILGSGITTILGSIAGLFGGKTTSFNMPSFQGFEGIIPGVPGTPIPAMVHAGEYIGQSAPGNTVNIYNPVVRSDNDIREITKQVSREMYRMQQLRYG